MKLTLLVVMLLVVTEMFCGPRAACRFRLKMAVIVVVFTTLTLVTRTIGSA